MLDVLSIEGVYCMDGQCDTYTGEVSLDKVMSGNFKLHSCNGKEAMINLDIITLNIDIAIDDHSGKTVKKELKGLEFTTNDDGSWRMNKNIGNDKFEITIR